MNQHMKQISKELWQISISNRECNHNYYRIPPSKAQYSSGKGQQRIKIQSQDISETVLCKGLSRNSSVCHQGNNSVSSVLLLKNGRLGSVKRCILTRLEEPQSHVRFPSFS